MRYCKGGNVLDQLANNSDIKIKNSNIADSNNVLDSTMRILNEHGIQNQVDIYRRIITDLLPRSSNGEFKLRDDDEEAGINTNVMGGLSLLLLIGNLYEKNREEISDEIRDVILTNIEHVFSYVDENGYDFSPYVKSKSLARVFRNKDYYSIETLTWVLSYLVQLRKLDRLGVLKLSDEVSKDIMTRIGDTLCLVRDSALLVPIKSGDSKIMLPGGWNFVNDCSFASIYYTAVVIEVLSEIDDVVLVRDFDILQENDPDYELIDFLGASLETVDVVSEATKIVEKRIIVKSKVGYGAEKKYYRLLEDLYSVKDDNLGISDGLIQTTSRWIWFTYKDILLRDDFRLDRQYSNDEVFYIMYLLEIIILSYTENFIPRSEVEELVETAMFFLDKRITEINHSKINTFGKQYYRPESEGLNDENDNDRKLINRTLGDYVLYGPSLTPLRIKLGSMYALYFTKYPDKKMSKELDVLLKNKLEDSWVWDIGGYNLMATEKSVEALNDFFTYYNLYEEKYFEVAQRNDELRQEVAGEVYDSVKKKIVKQTEDRISQEYNKQIEQILYEKENIVEELKNTKYKFHHQLESYIEDVVDTRLEHSIANELHKYFTEIDMHNRNPNAKISSSNQHAETLKSIWMSSIFNIAGLHTDERNGKKVMNVLESDLETLINGLVEVVQHCIQNNGDQSELVNISEELLNRVR